MERVTNEENEWDQTLEINIIEGPVERITRKEIVETM